MASKIEWTRNADGTQGRTWEPVLGCSSVSSGCTNCYAERLTWRLANNPVCGKRYRGLVEMHYGRPYWTGEVRCDASVLEQPLHWRKPTRIFVCSRSDLFHPKVPFSFIAEVFNVMFGEASSSPQPKHTYLVLTKRAARMREFFDWCSRGGDGTELAMMLQATLEAYGYFPRVWLGVTVENQAATKRLDDLVATPAAMHFVSYELAVEAVDFRPYLGLRCEGCGAYGRTVEWCRIGTGYDNGHVDGDMPCGPMTKETPCVDWVIAGGESGPHSRPCDVAWIRSVVKQCQAAETPVFVKQLGSNSVSSSDDDRRHCGDMTLPDGFRMIFRDRKGADPREWPEDLRIRQYPDVRR